jgi:hypothetical protein
MHLSCKSALKQRSGINERERERERKHSRSIVKREKSWDIWATLLWGGRKEIIPSEEPRASPTRPSGRTEASLKPL